MVEGTALASLPFMESVLKKRPGSFPSAEAAVEWALQTGFSRNAEAAALSVPAMLKERERAQIDKFISNSNSNRSAAVMMNVVGTIKEEEEGGGGGEEVMVLEQALTAIPEENEVEEEEEMNGDALLTEEAVTKKKTIGGSSKLGLPPRPPPSFSSLQTTTTTTTTATTTTKVPTFLNTSFGVSGAWLWRTPLKESSKYWEGWYTGLSTAFLNLKVPKILILAGTDRLDRELLMGQMQGKFQLVLLSRAGHAVHEDESGEVAAAVAGFIKRFRVGQADKSFGVPGINRNDGQMNGWSLFRVPEPRAPDTAPSERPPPPSRLGLKSSSGGGGE